MKTILLLIFCAVSLWFCDTKAVQKDNHAKRIASLNTDSTFFKTQVKPLLEKKCSPCHFTGGKIYERMPFDKEETILNHEAGILKRFKDEKEADLLKQFIQQHK
jgi:hypothetical protein